MGGLTDELAFLGERRYAVLATHDPDGGIRLAPIWYLFEDDRFHFARRPERRSRTSSETPCHGRGRRARAGAERWVSASGPVEILLDGEAQRSMPDSGADTSRRKRSTARSDRAPRVSDVTLR